MAAEEKKTLLFTLFRLQIFLPEQLPLFDGQRTIPDILHAAVSEKPTATSGGSAWHIGNIVDIPTDGIFFAIGKLLPRQVGLIDEAGDFLNTAAMIAPNTHVILDLRYQVVAIAKNSELSPESKAIASKLKKLLQSTEVVRAACGRVSVDSINDPAEFLEIIQSAAAVVAFQVSYALPNVWDAEEDFQKPFQETARALKSEIAVAKFQGEDLDRSRLADLTRAASSVGKWAKARIRRERRQRPVSVSTDSNPVTHAADPVDQSQPVRWAQETLAAIRRLYEQIRASE